MFWRFATSSSSRNSSTSVEAFLDKEDFTLEELLAEEDILKECKALNIRLINFLRHKTQVEQLLRYIVEEPPEEAGSEEAGSEEDGSEPTSKFPLIACQILTCEIDVIFNTLVGEEELMDLLFSFLEPYRSHSPKLAEYFSKVVLCLLLRRTVPLMNYVQAHQDVFSQLVDLIGITSIMEVLIRIVEPDAQIYPNYINVLQWLADNNFLEMIMDKLSPSNPPEVNANAAETLCAVTRTAPSPLATRLSSPSSVSRLFGHALEDTNSKSLVHSLSVLISLLDPRRSSSLFHSLRFQDNNESLEPVNLETVCAMLPNLGHLVAILDVSTDAKILPTTYGVLKPPLGKHRLKVVEFIAALLKSGYFFAADELVTSGAIRRILDLLFEYPYNNELHHNVESITYSCLESQYDFIVDHLLGDCNLVGKILQADKHPTLFGDSNKPTIPAPGVKVPKPGYLGHLTRISDKIDQLGNSDARILAHTQENREWNDWVTDVLLERTVVEDVYSWVCGRPSDLQENTIDSDEEDDHDGDYKDYDENGTEEGERALDQDGEDVYYDGGEVVIKTSMLDEEYGRSLFTNPNWFAFQDDIIDDTVSTSPLPEGMNEINETSTSNRDSSGSADKVVVGIDEGLPESANSDSTSSSRDTISSVEKILKNEEDLNLQMEKASTPGSSTNPFSDQMDTDGTIPSDESPREIVPNDTSTSISSSNPVASELQAAPEPSLSEVEIVPNDTSTSISSSNPVASELQAAPETSLSEEELEGLEKAMEQAFREGKVGEARASKRIHISKMLEKKNPEESAQTDEFYDAK